MRGGRTGSRFVFGNVCPGVSPSRLGSWYFGPGPGVRVLVDSGLCAMNCLCGGWEGRGSATSECDGIHAASDHSRLTSRRIARTTQS